MVTARLGLFPSALTQSHTRATTILIDELDSAGFQCAPNRQVIGRRVIDVSLSASSARRDRGDPERFVCEIFSTPARSARAALI